MTYHREIIYTYIFVEASIFVSSFFFLFPGNARAISRRSRKKNKLVFDFAISIANVTKNVFVSFLY